MKYIYSKHKQNYLAYYGIYPEAECLDGSACYYKTPKLLALLDRYEIEYYIIPNR